MSPFYFRREKIAVFNQLIPHVQSVHVQCDTMWIGWLSSRGSPAFSFQDAVYHHKDGVSRQQPPQHLGHCRRQMRGGRVGHSIGAKEQASIADKPFY